MPKSNATSKDKQLSTQPYKGTKDYFPEDLRVRRYIFDIWRSVCESYGYEEYQTPLLEEAELYRAKSGDEVGGKELFTLTDMAGRELAIRPEMTPSVTRMIARKYASMPKPIRVYNISNFMRQEKPQRGRNREFWQLNYDVFGVENLHADLEVLLVSLEIMLRFNPPEEAFTIKLNNRILLDDFLKQVLNVAEEKNVDVTRLMDKYEKLDAGEFKDSAEKIGLNAEQQQSIVDWMEGSELPDFESQGVTGTQQLLHFFNELGYGDYIEFSPGLVRGFDYYDGMIFEVFDNHPENKRSLFGGGRYNGLASLFGSENFPAVGAAPGDETLSLFLESWDILPQNNNDDRVFLPLLVERDDIVVSTAMALRRAGIDVVQGLEMDSFSGVLSKADQKGYKWVILIGSDEVEKGTFALKNMQSGDQQEYKTVEDVIEMIQSNSSRD